MMIDPILNPVRIEITSPNTLRDGRRFYNVDFVDQDGSRSDIYSGTDLQEARSAAAFCADVRHLPVFNIVDSNGPNRINRHMISRHYFIARSHFGAEADFLDRIRERLNAGNKVHVQGPRPFQLVKNGPCVLLLAEDGSALGTYSDALNAVESGEKDRAFAG